MGVAAMTFPTVGSPRVLWSNPDYSMKYAVIERREYRFLPFVGTDMYFESSGPAPYTTEVFLIGFYK